MKLATIHLLPDGRTHVGQAHFAGSGPSCETCGSCRFWDGQFNPDRVLQRIKPGRCAKHAELRQCSVKSLKAIPHSALACRYWEPKP